MESAAIVPYRDVVDILPLEANLQIVVVFEELLEPSEKHVALFFGDAVDKLAVLADWVEALPACHWVCSHHWMDGS